MAPLTVKLLLRLIAAEGQAVPASQIYLDLWGDPISGRVGREQRNEVQKRVHELRRAMEPEDQPEPILRTERYLGDRYPQSAYRLVLDTKQLDYLEFIDLANRAGRAAPASAVALLTLAEDLWRGKPLADAASFEFAVPLITRLDALHEAARRELIKAHTELGYPEQAVTIAEQLAAEAPHDPEIALLLQTLRAHVRGRYEGEILRREFPGVRVRVIVQRGDLFEQPDANLAVGFGDTFDTSTDGDVVIARESVQGQLLDRVYRGDRDRLDAELRKGLRGVTPVAKETYQDKPKGKRTRYAVGTVAVLPLNGRRLFAIAHCRQDLNLVTHSSAEELRLSLDQLWKSVRVHGMLKPLAIPLVGSKLARVVELSHEQMMIMIIDTFLRSCREERCTTELRIVILPSEVEQIRMTDVARFVETLDQEGREPR